MVIRVKAVIKLIDYNMLARSFRDRRISLAIYCLGVAAYSLMIIAIWPSMQGNLETLEQLWENYPEGLKAAFGADVVITSFDGFLTLEYFSLMWIIIVAPFAISVSTAAFSGEIEKGTMELLLSQPISRRLIAFSRMAFLELGLLLIVFATMIPVVIGTPLVDEDIKFAGILSLGLLGFILFLCIGSIGLLFSCLMSDRGRAIFLVVGVLIFSYALDILAQFSDTVEKVHFLSLFDYYDPFRYIHNADVAWGDLAVLGGIMIVADVLATVIFRRRDIAV
jgi:ABC-2 type transport system permease protein